MSVKINSADWQKIEGIVKKVDQNRDKIFKSIRLQWGIQVLEMYRREVASAMGSVRARGGYVRLSFLDVNGKEEWQALRPRTLLKKAENAGEDISDIEDLKEAYDTYSAEFFIWSETGDTARAVRVYPKEAFAGIDAEFSELEYKKAKRVEKGEFDYGRMTPRRLFEVANRLFIEAVGKALSADDSPMSNLLREELIQKVFIGRYNWGGK